MKNRWKRLISASLALVLTGSLALPALADTPEISVTPGDSAELLDVTAGSYSPDITVQSGKLYTLIALPFAADPPQVLTAADLVGASGNALFIGSATADTRGKLTFQDVRLRTAEAAVYYVTGPGLEPPYREATGASTSAEGMIHTASQDSSAAITLVDKETDYRYNTGIYSDKTGYYSTGHLAPGKYKLRVEKEGYLPYLSVSETDYLDVTSGESVYHDVDISANVGDVTGDGVRDMTDLAALLTYYGGNPPQGITADLDYSGAVDAADAALLAARLTTGTQANVTDAAIVVQDGGGVDTAGLRFLSFELDTKATVSAAAFSLTFQNHDIQLLTPQGGLTAPVDGGTVANCLLAADGFTARLISWRVSGNQTTLSFAVTADKPHAAGQVARLFYRPTTGSTESFYNGVFSLDHAAALVGKDTVVTQKDLIYPGSNDILLDSITIDQKPAPGASQATLTIPPTGLSNYLPLTATGHNGQTAHPDLKGVTWSLDKSYGDHVSMNQNLLTVTSGAPLGDVVVRAQFLSHGNMLTDSIVVSLRRDTSTPGFVKIYKDSTICNQDSLVCDAGDSLDAVYTAKVYDQYGDPLTGASQVTWSLVDAPAGLSVKDGVLVADWSKLAAGSYSFTLCAQTGAVQATVAVELKAEAKLGSLVITGPASATLPTAGNMVLTYTVSALDQQGRPMELDQVFPSFGISPTGKGVSANRDNNGNYNVNISPSSQAGRYTLTAQVEQVSTTFALELLSPETPTATRAAIFLITDGQKEELITTSSHTLTVGQSSSVSYTAKLLDENSELLKDQTGSWKWALSSTNSAITLSASGATAALRMTDTLAVGHYAFTLTATETTSGLTVTLPVNLTVSPVLTALALSAPPAMTIPTGQTAAYTLPLSAFDAGGNAIDLPADLTWSVTRKGSSAALTGVTVEKGVLTVSPNALPGDITVTVTAKTGSAKAVTASADITLTPPGSGLVLALYRQITVDSQVVQANAPALNTGDAIHIKEGQSAVITYTAMLVDQSTNTATPLDADKVKWMGGQSVFTVDGKAQVGDYATNPIAVYDGLTAPASATVSVYPNITDLALDFGPGHEPKPPYTLVVPSGTPQTYTATVVATILRDGKSLQLPLRELGLSGYELKTDCYYTGVYLALDKAAGTLSFTVDPVAIQNPTDGSTADQDLQVLGMTLDYFPGESLKLDPVPFLLSKETLVTRNAFLRRGVRAGSRFVFDTPKEDRITIPAGIFALPSDVFSSCYALELLDQYNRPLTGQGDVTWSLDGSPKNAKGEFLVTLFSPGEVTEKLHANYSSIRRLRISAQTPAGTYPLTISATCGAFKRSLHITLEVVPGDAPAYNVALPECGQQIIPRHFKSYNKFDTNENKRTLSIAPILYTADGLELDPANHTAQWSVSHSQGNAVTGVSVAADKDNTTQATVTIDRTAKTTNLALDDFLSVNVTVKTPDGKEVGKADSTLELIWDNPVPTIMQVTLDNKSIEQDSITVTSTQTVTRTYGFALWDQYGRNRVPQSTQSKVEWRVVNPVSNSGVSTKVDPKTNTLQVTINKLSRSAELALTAAITVTDANAQGGKVTVFKQIPLKITVSSKDNNGGGGGGGGGGLDKDTSDTSATAGPPASLTINGGSTLSATQGSQASRTFTATLKDAKGKACALSYDAKVTWSATGLSGGLTFNTSTHVLTVPATVAPGTYTVSITAAYSSTVRQTLKVTVTVKAKDASTTAPTDVTLAPPVTRSGVTGTASLTPSQEQALLAATGVSGGTVTIVPSGGDGLTSLSVSLTSATATAIAGQRNQSLRIQCAFGTVVLSPEALKALAAKGGQTTTVTIASTSGGLKVDFTCGGVNATSLPGSIILNAYTQGNVALKVDANGAATVLKKALVEEGKIYTYLTGSTQLKLETRASSFGDTKGHWAQSAIDFTVARELFQGTSATTFEPGGNMTRSMVVTVLHRLEDTPAPASAAQFADVVQGSWYTNAISWANAKGIVQGTNAGFKPNDPVTREQLATILYRYVNSLGLSTNGRGSLSSFSDQAKVSSWARDAMEWAVGQGLINGKSGGLLDPGGYASRAEVSTILERLIRSMVPVV